jgi:hypothetical protein
VPSGTNVATSDTKDPYLSLLGTEVATYDTKGCIFDVSDR